MTTTRTRLIGLLVGVGLLLTACGGGSDDGGGDATARGDDVAFDGVAAPDEAVASEGAMAPDAGLAVDGDEATEAAAGPPASSGTPLGSVDPAVAAADRQIISTGRIRVLVDDLDRAVRQVGRVVEDAEGLIFAEETDLRTGARTRLVVKVPPAAFRDTLADLGALGDVEVQSVTTDDVTDLVVDLDSRIATSEASVLRLRALLAEADAVADVARIEGELLRRETDLESLRGQLRTIEDQVALATITVTLRAERTSPPPPPEVDEPQAGFVDGLRGGWDALRTMAVGLSAVAGALLPWLPLLAVAAWLARRLWLRPRPVT